MRCRTFTQVWRACALCHSTQPHTWRTCIQHHTPAARWWETKRRLFFERSACVHKQPIVRISFIKHRSFLQPWAEWSHNPDCFWSNDIKHPTLTLPVCCVCMIWLSLRVIGAFLSSFPCGGGWEALTFAFSFFLLHLGLDFLSAHRFWCQNRVDLCFWSLWRISNVKYRIWINSACWLMFSVGPISIHVAMTAGRVV